MTARPALDALFWFLERHAPPPEPEQSVLFLNAQPHQGLSLLLPACISFCQTWRPYVDALSHRGVAAAPEPKGMHDLVLWVASRSHELNRSVLHTAKQHMKPKGMLIASLENSRGGRTLQAEIEEHFSSIEVESKAHSRVIRARTPRRDANHEGTQPAGVVTVQGWSGTLHTAPGVFSSDAVDEASALLADALPAHLGGIVGDVGSGCGYLATEVLRHSSTVKELHLFEADFRALECSKINLHPYEERVAMSYHWVDVLTLDIPPTFDWVVTNPPFHQDGKTDFSYGSTFVAAALKLLTPHGTLLMVANQHLPYEKALSSLGCRCTCSRKTSRFCVYEVRRAS